MPAPILFRRRLVTAIDEEGNQIVYIHGPAGYGKSVLARQWADSQDRPTVWFEGTSSSNASELLNLLISKITESIPALDRAFANFDVSESLTVEDISRFLGILEKERILFNLVIDNAESIRKSHNDLSRYLVSQIPPNVRLILVTQTSPRTSFIKEHGIDHFTVISPADLNFTQDELSQLARQLAENLAQKQIVEIHRLTEGWPAGVQIALSQLEFSDDIEEMISSIRVKGKHQFALASKRILASLEADQYQIVSSLALLDEIDADSALSISEDVDVVRKLTVLSQESMVINQTGFNPPKFSINPILRTTLVDEIQGSPNFSNITERVINFLLKRGDIRTLSKVLLEIGAVKRLSEVVRDPELAQRIDISIQESISRGSVNELRNWTLVAKAVPELGEGPELILSFYLDLLSGDFNRADSHLQSLRAFLARPNSKLPIDVLPDISAMESIALFARGRLREAFDLALQAYEQASQKASVARHHQITYLQLALLGAVILDEDEKVRTISKILDSELLRKIAQTRGDVVAGMRTLIAAQEGRYNETRNQLVSPLGISSSGSCSGFFGPYGVILAESMLTGESGDIEGSIKLLSGALERALRANNHPTAVALLGRLSYQHILKGKSSEALEALAKARELIVTKSLSEELHESVDIWEIRVRYLLMDFERTQELMQRPSGSYLKKAFEAGMYINTNPQRAAEIIETFDLTNPRQQLTYHLFRAHIFSDAPTKQLEEVRKAVEIGSKHGYFNHFLTQRSDVIQAYISLAAEYPTSFNERLARAAGERLNEMMVGKDHGGEALTRREADILRHLSTGLPIRDIANNLNISKNTIKTHLRNLYRKLGAEDRIDAVAKGKRLLRV